MTMSKFFSAPRRGHLDQMKRTYEYLCKFCHNSIHLQVDKPYCSNVPTIMDHHWEHMVYGNHEEDMPIDAPPPLGKRIVFTYYINTNLMHDLLSGKAVTSICTFYSKTPVDWYYKQ